MCINRENLLTQAEHDDFHRDGFLLLKNAIQDEEYLQCLEEGMNDINGEVRDAEYDPYRGKDITRHDTFICMQFLNLKKAFAQLAVYPGFFDKLWGILGWNIYCDHTNFVVTPPLKDRHKYLNEERNKPEIKEIHRDDGRVNSELLQNAPHGAKVATFISDCSTPLNGNLCVIPGSQNESLYDFKPPQVASIEKLTWIDYIKADELDKDAERRVIPIIAKRGDVLIFDRRLWHTRSKNLSDRTRKVLFYGYQYRWMVGDSYTDRSFEKLTEPGFNLTPVFRQIMGAGRNRSTAYHCQKNEVPLRVHMQTLERHGVIENGIEVPDLPG